MEERYKKYLEKAKSVSVSLRASHCTFSLCFADVSKYSAWASLVAQWLRARLPVQGTQVRALVWEDPTCHGTTKPVCRNY